jgi:hypothetical protein
MTTDNSTLEGVIMGLSGWTWNIFGIIVAAISGYIYLFVPRNGSPNSAMALFFFVGLIFIIVGTTKIMLAKKTDTSVMNALKESDATIQQKALEMQTLQQERPNKVEAAITQAMTQAQVKAPAQNMQQGNIQANIPAHQRAQQHHTNSYHNIHQYKGPVYNPTSGTHAQHPVTVHTQTAGTQAHHTMQQPASSSTHGIRCKKCGNVNAGHAVYCHQCGNRLR